MGELCYAFEYPEAIASTMHISQLEALNCVVAARAFLGNRRNLCAQVVVGRSGISQLAEILNLNLCIDQAKR